MSASTGIRPTLSGAARRVRRDVREQQDAPGLLLISASMGGGHDGVAYELQRRVRAAGGRADVVDYLDFLPWRTGRVVRGTYVAQLRYAPQSYEWLYATLESSRVADAVARGFAGLARRRLLRLARRGRYGAVVATYPLAGQAIGRLRREGRLGVPALTFLTDADVHEMWLDSGIDEYLAVYPTSAREAGRRGASAVTVVGPVVAERHTARVTPEERRRARRTLGLEAVDGPVVLVAAGSWGTGDVAATVAALVKGGIRPVVLCGRNDELRAKLAATPGVSAIGWTDDVRSVLAAADVLVHNAGGLSALEAFGAGIPVIGHACLPGHGWRNAAALADAGVAALARDDAELVALVHRYAATPLGAAMADRAVQLFRPDPAPALLARATAGSVRASPPALTASGRRLVRVGLVAALSAAALGPLAGPALAHGVDEVVERTAGGVRAPDGIPVVWTAALLDASEVADPSVGPLLKATGVSAVVPAAVAAQDSVHIRALRGHGVAVLAGVVRNPGMLHPFADRDAVRLAGRAVALASGEPCAPVVVRDGVTDAFLHRSGSQVGLADEVVRQWPGRRLHRGEAVVLDLRGVGQGQRAVLLADLARRTQLAGLRLEPWGELWGLQ